MLCYISRLRFAAHLLIKFVFHNYMILAIVSTCDAVHYQIQEADIESHTRLILQVFTYSGTRRQVKQYCASLLVYRRRLSSS